jgi:hypothetical protein
MKKRKSKSQKYLEVLKLHETFNENCKEARKRFLETAKYNKTGKLISWNSRVLEAELNKLLMTYPTLQDSWRESLEGYLKTGNLVPPISATQPIVKLEKIQPSGRSKLTVQVFKHTTKKEYLNAWKEVERYQKLKFKGKDFLAEFKPSSISKADVAILQQYKKGKSDREIADYLSEHSVEIYGEDKAGETPVESTVRSRLKTLRRHLDVQKKR